MDKEVFAIVSTFQRLDLEYLLWGGVNIDSDHRNMANIFSLGGLVAELPKATAPQLVHWRVSLGQLDYQIIHIAGSENCWGDLLSRWRKLGTEGDVEASGRVESRSIQVRSVMVDAML